ncbi:MAG: hypothetical protein SGJ13_07210 [Actinomycetota bacterium]|nr:hypothetical protein [Actinomycetota bacterium]
MARREVRRRHRSEVRGPQGIFAKIPGLGAATKLFTRVLPLRRGTVEERDGTLYVG